MGETHVLVPDVVSATTVHAAHNVRSETPVLIAPIEPPSTIWSFARVDTGQSTKTLERVLGPISIATPILVTDISPIERF